MRLRVVEAYGVTSIQSLPSPGRRAYGVPPGGAFDLRSFAFANALLGNDPAAPALEIALGSLVLRAETMVTYAWAGAGASNMSATLKPAEELRLAYPQSGCRSYLALPGGVRRCGSGLEAGRESHLKPMRLAEEPPAGDPIAVVPGPQADLFDLDRFVQAEYEVAPYLDRVGVRLTGAPLLEHRLELPSEPAIVGAIQVPPNGQPIIIGPDGPTMGGYPKIAVVIGADLHRIGQLRPGDKVRFRQVLLEEARESGGAQNAALGKKLDIVRRLSVKS